MADRKDDKFYESMPATSHGHAYAGSMRMNWRQTTSLVVGVGLLFAALGGWWTALQSNGQILGIFAFNAWNTALALVAGALAVYAAFYASTARAVWTVLALAYAFMTIVGLIVGSNAQVIGLFANNFNNVWMYAAMTIIFGYMAATSQEMT